MKVRTFFKIKINIADLDKYMPSADPCLDIYAAELVQEEQDISMKIFYPSRQYLGKKIGEWNHASETELLRCFEVVEILQPSNLKDISFSDYEIRGMSIGTYSEFDLEYFIIQLKGVRKVFSTTGEKTEFFLAPEGFRAVEMNYTYPLRFPWTEEPYSWAPKNGVKEFIPFDQIRFKPEHNFFNATKNSISSVSIGKEPRLVIEHDGLSESEIKNHVTLLLALYSFYSHTEVDYTASKIQTENEFIYEVKEPKPIEHDGHGIFRWECFQNPLNLIVSVNAPHLLANLEFVKNIMYRFNYALQTEGESKFMILYNVLEQIRNQYILDKKIEQEKAGETPNLKKVVEEYSFTVSNTQRDKVIKENLEKIAEIVSDDQKALFLTEVSQKVPSVRLLSMANQFNSLFDYMKIDPSECALDFNRIKALRNTIFHGTPVGDDREYLEKINRYQHLPRFVGIAIMKYFGIEDINTIKRDWN